MDALLVGPVLPNVENHSLAALARAARAGGFEVATESYRGFADIDAVAAVVRDGRPRLIGVSMQTTETALASATLVEVLRRRGYGGLVVLGGHFATLNAEGLLGELPAVDAVVRFAGEAALVALLRDGLRAGQGVGAAGAAVPGLVTRDGAGGFRHGAAPILDLAPRAFPTAPEDQPVHLGFPSADLVASRGCAAHCGYCCVAGASDEAERLGGPRADRRAQGALADEMAALYHGHRVRVFNFMDDNLLPMEPEAARAWTDELATALAARRVGRIAFSLQLRADVCTPDVVRALAELGLVRAYVGIDGYSGRQLVALGRDAPADAGPAALALLAEAGVFSVCNALILGPTFAFEAVRGEIEALARVRGAPVHLLPIDVRAGSTYFERVRRRGLLEGGTLCWRYRFADPRTALLGEALLGLPTRLEEYSVPVALYDLGYNLGVARRLLPDAPANGDVARACDVYREVSARWNADQVRVLRAAAAAAAGGERAAVRCFLDEEGPRVRALDDELRALVASALAAVERAASRAHGAPVHAHARGRLIAAAALSAALAACNGNPLAMSSAKHDAGAVAGDAAGAQDAGSEPPSIIIGVVDAGGPELPDGIDAADCPKGLGPVDSNGTIQGDYCGALTVEVTFDAQGVVVPGSLQLLDGGLISQGALDCIQGILTGYCYPSYAGTTQTLVSHHLWVA
jgi:methylmalonyl-CoA mutase cobalamin-binding subunit